jgi:hypothetical protein
MTSSTTAAMLCGPVVGASDEKHARRLGRVPGQQPAEVGVQCHEQPPVLGSHGEHLGVRRATHAQACHRGHVMATVGERACHTRTEAFVQQELHALVLSGISLSRSVSAANVSASRTSATVSCGNSRAIPSGD